MYALYYRLLPAWSCLRRTVVQYSGQYISRFKLNLTNFNRSNGKYEVCLHVKRCNANTVIDTVSKQLLPETQLLCIGITNYYCLFT